MTVPERAVAMSTAILRIDFEDRSLAPAQAEVWVRVVPQRHDAGTDVRGRLLGPRCVWASTVEVAYPLRPLPPGVRAQGEGLTMRVVIPEASLWDPESPFLYEGPIELWQDGARCERILMRHGLRAFGLSPRGLLVNGKVRTLRGLEVDRAPNEAQARGLRREGFNLLIADVARSEEVWDEGNRLGFFVLGRITADDADTLRWAARLTRHASFLGWLAPARADCLDRLPGGGLVGVEMEEPSAEPPEGAAFVLGPAGPEGRPLIGRGGALVLGSVAASG
jgi:hypothetical protein